MSVLREQLAGLWAYRWQIWVDVTKDLLSDSRETAGRFFWVVAMPLVPLGVYLFLAKLRVFAAHDAMEGVVYVVVGATLWLLFTSLFLAPLNAIRSKGKTARQSRYPLAAVVASAVGGAWIEFLVRLVLCGVVLGFTQWPSPLGVVLFLAAVIPLSFVFLGAGMIVGVFAVASKDLAKLTPIAIQYLFFLSNVLFAIPADRIPQWLIWANPFAFAIDTSRWVLMFGVFPDLAGFLAMVVAGVLLMWKGLHFLGLAEPRLASHL
ncbi:MAG TPA: ABC transporter permease [Terricaulis sp.]|nr:ABC transporter permease [Terricaulis sp.]